MGLSWMMGLKGNFDDNIHLSLLSHFIYLFVYFCYSEFIWIFCQLTKCSSLVAVNRNKTQWVEWGKRKREIYSKQFEMNCSWFKICKNKLMGRLSRKLHKYENNTDISLNLIIYLPKLHKNILKYYRLNLYNEITIGFNHGL